MAIESLRKGDLVEVKSAAEILATLDERGAYEGLPFMLEMVAYAGQRLVVDVRADKICDTVKLTGSRTLPDSVLLGDLRCNGTGHGGCQAECRLYFKSVWLKRVRPEEPPPAPSDAAAVAALTERVSRQITQMVEIDGKREECWSCQATRLFDATTRVSTFNPVPYMREYTNGNVPLGRFVRVAARAVVEEPMRKFGLTPKVFLKGKGTKSGGEPPLNLQPGELVQVKSAEEIAATLNESGHNRGLWFDREMIPYCGKTFRVRRRVNRFIDDYRGGRMVELKTEAITLEGVVCTGDLSQRRWFCPRKAIPYWRECWLRRVEGAPA